MDIVLLPSRAGKTTNLIERSANTGYHMVVRDHKQARSVVQKAEEIGLRIHFPLTYADFIERRYEGREVEGVLIGQQPTAKARWLVPDLDLNPSVET